MIKNKALQIFNHFGTEKQERKLVEEVLEFLKAYILYINGLDSRDHVVEEFSDVELMMLEFKEALKITDEEQRSQNNFKIKRTFEKYKIGE